MRYWLTLFLLLASCASTAEVREVSDNVAELSDSISAQRETVKAVSAVVTKLFGAISAQEETTEEVRSAATAAKAAADLAAKQAEETRSAALQTKEKVERVATDAEARSSGFVNALLGPNGAVAGVISIATAVILNSHRSRTRKRDLKHLRPPEEEPA
jgi:ABC-type transporter Mla subunit MlaD